MNCEEAFEKAMKWQADQMKDCGLIVLDDLVFKPKLPLGLLVRDIFDRMKYSSDGRDAVAWWSMVEKRRESTGSYRRHWIQFIANYARLAENGN